MKGDFFPLQTSLISPNFPARQPPGWGVEIFHVFRTAVAAQGSLWWIGRCAAVKSAASRTICGWGAKGACMTFASADLSPLISRLRDSFPSRGSLLYAVRTWQIWLCIVDCLCDPPSPVAYATNCSQFSSHPRGSLPYTVRTQRTWRTW